MAKGRSESGKGRRRGKELLERCDCRELESQSQQGQCKEHHDTHTNRLPRIFPTEGAM